MFVGSIVGFTGVKDVSPWRPLHVAPEADHQRVLLGRAIGRVVADAAVAHRPGLRLKGKVGVCDFSMRRPQHGMWRSQSAGLSTGSCS